MGSVKVKRKLLPERNDEVDETLNEETTGQTSQKTVRSVHSRKYDVFISHRGPDTKKTFVSHLREALCNAGFSPFLDAKAIEPGSHVLQSIDEALSDAWAHVVVFSKGFAESKYCLYELCRMLELRNKLILPVFYDVQPEHLRFTDSGPFAEGFRKHQRRGRLDDEIGKWKNALLQVADRRGFRMDEVSGDEQQLVRSIVVAVQNQMPVNLQGEKRLFGVEESMREILEKVDAMGDNVGILGFYGMGGIGKTTLADELYRHLLARGGWKASFLTDVRSKAPLELQRQLVHDLIQEKEMLGNSHIYRQWFNRVRTQRVLIVVDDIDNVNQFTNLVLDFDLHPGSRIVVTSRHRDVLNRSMGLAHHRFLHEVKVLNSMYSRQIFNWHAFLSEAPTTDEFCDLAEKVADACGGHPLALEVIGASLFDKKDPETDRSLWMDAIKTLTENGDVLDKFKLSYYSLPSDGDKAMFRDIACLLVGMREEVALEIWKSCQSCNDYCSTTKGPGLVLRRLVDKSLVKIRDGVLSMHDLIRDMGRDIVMKEVPRERPGERTHLWNAGTAAKVLRRNQGTDRIRGLTLSPIESNFSTVTYAAAQFASMHELHLLILDGCIVEGDDFSSWSEELRWLQWRWSPCTELPFHLKLPKLTVLDLTDSINLSCLWKEDALVEFPWLQRLIVKNCRSIAALPQDIGYKLPSLRILDLENCSLLRTLPDSIGRLKNLERLILSSCNNLRTLPESIGQLKNLEQLLLYLCAKLETLPNTIVNLRKLKKLVLLGCIKISRLPLDLGSLMNLEELDLTYLDSLHELPSSMSRLRKLKEVHMGSTGVLSLPNNFGQFMMNLRTLNLKFCKIDMLPQSFEGLKTLVFLNLDHSNLMGRLPSYFGAFTALKTLKLENVRELVAIDALPQSLQHLDLYKCCKLMHLPSLAGMIYLKYFNMFECKSLLGVEGVEFLTTLEEIDLAGCVSMVSCNLQIVQNTSALRSCRLSGSKIGVSYNNTWFEKEPALQVISYYGNVMGFLVDNTGRKTLQIELGSKALVMDSTILSKRKCIGVIICIVMRTQGKRENFGCDLEACVTRDNVEIIYASNLCQVEYLDHENRVYLITLRRQHPLVQSLKFGDKICVFTQNTMIYPIWQGIVEEGAICVIHGENNEQFISINSKLLNKAESVELSTNLGKLILADHSHSSLDDSLQYLNTRRTESTEPRNSEVCEQQGAWTMPPRYGEFMSHQCDSWKLPRAGQGIISFTAEGGLGVSIEIADPNGLDRYQILIGRFTCIRRFYHQGFMADVSVVEKDFLHRKLPNQLWVSMDERTSIIQVGRGELPGEDHIISHYMDPEFFPQVQRVSFTTHDVPITYSNISFMDVDQHMYDLSYRLPDELYFEAVMDGEWTIGQLGGLYSWARYWKLPSIGRGVLQFEVNSVSVSYQIAISACPSTMDPMYEINIQREFDEETAIIRRSTGGHISCQVSRCPEIRGANRCWVSVDEETMMIQIGAGDSCQANTFCSWKDPDFLSDSLYFTFTTTNSNSEDTITFSNVSVAALPES